MSSSEPAPARRLRAYRFALDPTKKQREALEQHAGAARWAYNYALAVKDEAYKARTLQIAEHWGAVMGRSEAQARKLATVNVPNKPQIQAQWHRVKGDDRKGIPGVSPWWRSVSTFAFQSAWKDADEAWKRFFDAHKQGKAASPDPHEERIKEARRRRKLQIDELVTMGYTPAEANRLATVRIPERRRKKKNTGLVGRPKFKAKGRSRDSFRLHHAVKEPTIRPDGYRHLQMPHFRPGHHGSLRLHTSNKRMQRALRRGGRVQSVTVSQSGNRWYASVLVDEPETTPGRETQGGGPNGPSGPSHRQKAAGRVGVDLGVHHLAALSTGEVIDNPKHLQRAQRKLVKLQREQSRRQGPDRRAGREGSARWERTRQKLARLQAHVAEQRAAYLHQITKDLSTRFAEVAIEDLNVAGMTSSAKGDADEPGTNVRAKSGLNRRVLDVAPGEFRRQLEYKTPWYGATVVYVDRFAPTSKTCSACGLVKAKLGLSERVFTCDGCGFILDRDINAARNIAAVASVPVSSDRRHVKSAWSSAAAPPVSGGSTAVGTGKRADPTGSPRRSDSSGVAPAE